MTLTKAALGNMSLLRQSLLVVGASLFIAIFAQVSVPFFPVPMTLQTLAILLVGFTLGARLGTAAVAAYLLEGAAGLPVFANFSNGAAFAGPTAGFLIGFLGLAFIAGFAADRGVRGVVGTAVVGIIASALLYVPGLAWPMALANVAGIEGSWAGQGVGFYWTHFMSTFLLGDAVKALIAALVVTGAWTTLAKKKSA